MWGKQIWLEMHSVEPWGHWLVNQMVAMMAMTLAVWWGRRMVAQLAAMMVDLLVDCNKRKWIRN